MTIDLIGREKAYSIACLTSHHKLVIDLFMHDVLDLCKESCNGFLTNGLLFGKLCGVPRIGHCVRRNFKIANSVLCLIPAVGSEIVTDGCGTHYLFIHNEQ